MHSDTCSGCVVGEYQYITHQKNEAGQRSEVWLLSCFQTNCGYLFDLDADLLIHLTQNTLIVILAKAGIQYELNWTPAFAGVTLRKMSYSDQLE